MRHDAHSPATERMRFEQQFPNAQRDENQTGASVARNVAIRYAKTTVLLP